MGVWGAGAFDNDASLDWVTMLCASSGVGLIVNAFEAVAAIDGEYLEVDECHDAIAASEVVAALKNAPSPQLPDRVKEWISTQQIVVDDPLIQLALGAIEKVRLDSELHDLWSEGDGPQEWYLALAELESRLRQ
jgi:hypothetical protein